MTALDMLIVAAYLAAVVGWSATLARQQASPDDYYVAGRRLPWWALGISTMATQSSANSFIGIPAFVALVPGGGLTWLQYELALPLALAVVMFVLVPVFRGLGLISIYEYLEARFDRRTRLLLSAVFLVSRALASGVALYAAALVVQVCTGLPLGWSVLLMGGLTVVYDMLGGMRAVVWTDVVQMAVLLAGLVGCLVFALQIGGGVQAVLQAVDPARLDAIDPRLGLGDGSRAPLWGFVVGGFVLYVAYYGIDQSQVQRQLSAVSVGEARRLLAFNALARFPLTFLYAALGLALAAVWVQSEALRAAVPAHRLDLLVPRFIELHLPAGLRGLLVAAVLAAAMSSLDSALNSLSAATLRDFVSPHIDPARQMAAARGCTLLWGVVITAFGLYAGSLASTVVEAINLVGALFYGPLLAAFACGILDPRATGPAVRTGVAAGLAVNVVLWIAFRQEVFWMWWNVSGLVVAVLTTAGLSRLRLAPLPDRAAPRARRHTALAMRQLWREGRGTFAALAAYSAFIFALLAWLGVRG
ncbi:MAG: sodium/solute symporter [Rubrivivax sp.]|nr:sodium/solute symporter [Rubrivivax sp.]